MLSIINVDHPDVELSGAFPDFIMRGFASYTLRVVYRSIFPESFIVLYKGLEAVIPFSDVVLWNYINFAS